MYTCNMNHGYWVYSMCIQTETKAGEEVCSSILTELKARLIMNCKLLTVEVEVCNM